MDKRFDVFGDVPVRGFGNAIHFYENAVNTSTLRNLNFPKADFWDTILCQFFVHLAKPVDSFVWRDDRCAAFFLVRG